MTAIKAVIADDEGPARQFLVSLLSAYSDVEIIGTAKNGREAVELIRRLEPDVAFLDLQMPETSGLDAVRELEVDELPQIVFVTAFDEYAVDAFELNAVDYLLKPVEKERLEASLERVRENLSNQPAISLGRRRVGNVVESFGEEYLARIPVKKRDDFYLLDVSEVESIVADGELLNIKSCKLGTFQINFRLKDLEQRLDPAVFYRLSRGTIINIDFLERINPMPGGTYLITMKDASEHSASRSQSRRLRQELLRL